MDSLLRYLASLVNWQRAKATFSTCSNCCYPIDLIPDAHKHLDVYASYHTLLKPVMPPDNENINQVAIGSFLCDQKVSFIVDGKAIILSLIVIKIK